MADFEFQIRYELLTLESLAIMTGWEMRRRFSIVSAYPLARSWRNPGTVSIPQYQFNNAKQHTDYMYNNDA